MASAFKMPKRGFVFWPVGTGDSTTIVVKENEIVFQLDLHHLEKSEDSDDPAWPIVDTLVPLLPTKNGKPYLSVFALTHPDKDHVLGFRELLNRVTIGEIWHTPRVFRDYEDEIELCEDAEVFRKEVHRRREAIMRDPGNIKVGDRVRIIGHDDILNEEKYRNFPRERTSIPGHLITVLDDVDVSDCFEAFVHAPFKVDAEDTRNNTSLSLHISLKDGAATGKAFFFGDREYPTLKQIFDLTVQRGRQKYLYWDVLLAPHHCSKRAMYWKDDGQEEESYKKDIMDYFENFKQQGGYLVVSSNSDFTDGDGDNPPHRKARREYEKIVDAGHFICTHEYRSTTSPEPLIFQITSQGTAIERTQGVSEDAISALSAAVSSVRGGTTPPQQQVGFGSTDD
jgi:beta-lactamase superfamily II metal-dependent hydrolase